MPGPEFTRLSDTFKRELEVTETPLQMAFSHRGARESMTQM